MKAPHKISLIFTTSSYRNCQTASFSAEFKNIHDSNRLIYPYLQIHILETLLWSLQMVAASSIMTLVGP